jgi:hypothetical protein
MSLKLENTLRKNMQADAALRETVADWLVGESDDYTHSVTPTFPYEPRDSDEAERILGRFKKYLNKECFRRPKTPDAHVKMAVVQEGQRFAKRIHYHCAMRKPDKFTNREFERRIKKAWRNAVRNYKARIDIQPYAKGWLPYITKEVSRTNTSGISQHNDF